MCPSLRAGQMNDRTDGPKLQGPRVARSVSFLCVSGLSFCVDGMSSPRLTRGSRAAHTEEPTVLIAAVAHN